MYQIFNVDIITKAVKHVVSNTIDLFSNVLRVKDNVRTWVNVTYCKSMQYILNDSVAYLSVYGNGKYHVIYNKDDLWKALWGFNSMKVHELSVLHRYTTIQHYYRNNAYIRTLCIPQSLPDKKPRPFAYVLINDNVNITDFCTTFHTSLAQNTVLTTKDIVIIASRYLGLQIDKQSYKQIHVFWNDTLDEQIFKEDEVFSL